MCVHLNAAATIQLYNLELRDGITVSYDGGPPRNPKKMCASDQ
jgi:hypothetical protein